MLEREKEWDIAPRAPSWALGSVAPGIPDATSPLRPARHPWGMLSAHITPRKSVQRSAPHPPPPPLLLLLLHCQPFPLIWSPVCGRHMGMSFLCVSVSAEPSVHDTHSKDAPWSSEHKENKKGLRAPSDGNVILQAFYRHLNCPRAYLYMHMQAHAHPHTQQIQCCDSRVKPRYHTIIYAWIILLMLLYTIIWMLLQSIKGLIMAIIDMIIGYLLIWSAHSSNHRWEETTV